MNELSENATMRERVEKLEEVVANLPQVECPVRNHFAPGVYIREMTVPADVTATGAVHKTEHLTVVVGHCFLTTDDGAQEFKGFHIVKSKPGIKRAIYAVTETKVATIHATDETDVDKLVELLTFSKSTELLGGSENRQLLAAKEREALK